MDDLGDAIAQALAALPFPSRFRPWRARVADDLLDVHLVLRDGGRLRSSQLAWVRTRHVEVDRELAPWQVLPVPTSVASVRLYRAGALARRSARLARRSGADRSVVAYLGELGRLLFVLACAVDGDTTLRVLAEALPA